jgi:transposase
MTNYKEILRLANLGISQTDIAKSCKCARKTVRSVLNKSREIGLMYPIPNETTDADLEKLMFPNKSRPIINRKYPDYDFIDKELLRNGVTLKLLWYEYCGACKQSNDIPLMYSQFCYHFQKYSEIKHATMHIHRKSGEQIEVDWAGDSAHIIDTDTGELIPCYMFVGVLNYSLYAYVEAFLSMKLEDWITAHVHMYQYFGGSSRMLIPDNLKTGVNHSDWYTPEINKTYHEMAEYYNTAVLPARIRSPKDKPSVEGTVNVISTWITAAIRNEKFFSIAELNYEIHNRLEIFNHKPFQKKEGNRYDIFVSDEKPLLTPLPSVPFEMSQWKQATVQFNYHISVDKMQYSVPYEYIKHIVDVRLTRHIIEVFYNNQRICSHKRLYGKPSQYSTVEAHMPEDHQKYLQWNKERFIEWAKKIGSYTVTVVKSILASYKVEQQGYKACMGLLKLSDKYLIENLELACKKALLYTPHPSYKNVKNILVTGQHKLPEQKDERKEINSTSNNQFSYTRGAKYYGGDNDDK